MAYKDLKQIEEAAANLARYIQERGAAASSVVIKAQADLIADRAAVFYEAVLGKGEALAKDQSH